MKTFNLFRNFSTSNKELFDISKAWFAVSLAFGIVLGGINSLFFKAFLVSAIAVGLGFLLHELSHKVIAQRYRFKAEFRSFDEMLFLAVIMSFFGFVFAAPGAVMILSNIYDKRKTGIISLAGPFTNIIISLLCLLVIYIFDGFSMLSLDTSQIISLPLYLSIPIIGFLVNSWLALFNMIPFWQFDGAKIFKWNKIIYFSMVIISIFLVFFLPALL
ncbi:MAG: site-2 protease family protein [Nanoarchaeota archaeon]